MRSNLGCTILQGSEKVGGLELLLRLLGNRKDSEFFEGKIADMLELVSMIQGTGAISEETFGKAGDDERTTGRSAGRDESGNL